MREGGGRQDGSNCFCRRAARSGHTVELDARSRTHARTCAHSTSSCDRCHAAGASELRQWFGSEGGREGGGGGLGAVAAVWRKKKKKKKEEEVRRCRCRSTPLLPRDEPDGVTAVTSERWWVERGGVTVGSRGCLPRLVCKTANGRNSLAQKLTASCSDTCFIAPSTCLNGTSNPKVMTEGCGGREGGAEPRQADLLAEFFFAKHQKTQ